MCGSPNRMSHRVSVEVCVSSVAGALAAAQAGADTIEVCAWPGAGGVTPSFGLLNTLQEKARVRKRVLVRPRPGGFHYSAEERQVLLRDVMMSGIGDKECGIVTGALDAHDLPDVELIKAVQLAAAGRELTFHRAIDHSRDPLRAVEMLGLLGVQRVLTSGGAPDAAAGGHVLRNMVERAQGRIAVAAAGSVRGHNVVGIVERTGVREVHFSADRPWHPAAGTGDPAHDPDVIDSVLNALAKAGLR